jgi:serine phosphatase RsbU (regulator of sigma subunit)
VVVLCSDGIAEVSNADEELFDYERIGEVVEGACTEGLSAEAIIDRIVEAVEALRGSAAQSDDMTGVVMKVR